MCLLVTGATGFIGRYIKRYVPSNISVYSVAGKKHYDLLDEQQIDIMLAKVRPTYCLHLAWTTKASYLDSPDNIAWAHAGQYLIRKFYEIGGKRFVGVGTCYEYTSRSAAHSEDESTCVPTTLYGANKLKLGLYLRNYARYSHLSWGWARPFFITGPGEGARRFVPSLIKAMSDGTGFQVRSPSRILDYMDVRDVARAMLTLLFSSQNGIFNICSGRGISMMELAQKLAQAVNCGIRIGEGNEIVNPMVCIGDNRKLTQFLNFKPQYSLEQTLADSIAYMKGVRYE